ncbi:hypothetical protein GUJ93_ZPchr0006g45708 [Zizania palustris]|uniref:Uncharacterized protein n=1 Tax=Zizania palustris TaxID=103762 RepID=A0A8J5SDJ3_ZIZPA|nr:hypothetical protein GUJ93_ZPchr0006g45708 [Zizania palustris]
MYWIIAGAEHGKKCGAMRSTRLLCGGDSGADDCLHWCVKEGYATGKCFDVSSSSCTCVTLCSGAHQKQGDLPLPAPEPTGRQA